MLVSATVSRKTSLLCISESYIDLILGFVQVSGKIENDHWLQQMFEAKMTPEWPTSKDTGRMFLCVSIYSLFSVKVS